MFRLSMPNTYTYKTMVSLGTLSNQINDDSRSQIAHITSQTQTVIGEYKQLIEQPQIVIIRSQNDNGFSQQWADDLIAPSIFF